MRCLGQIKGRSATELFVAYLLTQDVSTQIESADPTIDTWEVWVRDEDKIFMAQEALKEFESNPADAKFNSAKRAAEIILADKERKRAQYLKNQKTFRPKATSVNEGGRLPPLTLTLIMICIALGLLTSFGRPNQTNEWGMSAMEELSFVSRADYNVSREDPAASIKKGEVWRIITPIFLHDGPLHLALNCYWLAVFGRRTERWLGTPMFALLVLALAVLPNLLQGLTPMSMQGTPFFVGISGVGYGLFGYVWMRSSMNPSLGMFIPTPIVFVLVAFMVLGLFNVFPSDRIAHLAHFGGFFVGALIAFAQERSSV